MREMFDVGVDIGTHRVAWAAFSYGEAEVDSLDYSADKFRRQMSRESELMKLADGVAGVGDYALARLWIERPYLSGVRANPTTTIGMAETVGAIRAVGPWASVELVNPSTWKAQVVGHGFADKDQVRAWLIENVPEAAAQCQTEDEYDALGLAIYGNGRAQGEILPPEPKKPKKRAARKV